MKTQIKRIILYCVLLVLCGAFNAQATYITYEATVTADNHYAIYTGNESSITYIGRNEIGPYNGDNPSWEYGYNWWYPEPYEFSVNSGDYIYVAAWSDDWWSQGWIGQFESSAGTILSNSTDWQVSLTFNDLDDGAAAPTISNFLNDINNASWGTITNYLDNGESSPWMTYLGISLDADWIWGGPIGGSYDGGSDFGEYQIFRTQVPAPVPEPATMLLLGSGLLGAAMFRRKRAK